MQETTDNNRPPSPSEEERLENIIQVLELDDQNANKFRTVLRLLVGGALIGWDELLTHLEQWEVEVRRASGPRETDRGTVVFVEPGSRAVPPLTDAQEIRYFLLGLLFETESRLYKRGSAIRNVAGRTTNALLSPWMRRMERSERLQPVRRRFDDLVRRGERVADHWIQRGRMEESHSRRLVLTATQDTFDASMEQLGQAPELQNLVKAQSAGLTREVLDEVRARTVSGDALAESFVRRALRRVPRRELPSPSDSGDETISSPEGPPQ